MTPVRIPLSRSDLVAIVDPGDAELAGRHTWRIHTSGYVSTNIKRAGRQRTIYLHRLIVDPGPGLTVDHANRDKLDNRRANLRAATRRQQNANQGRRADNTTGYRGVGRARDRWRAQIDVGGGRQRFLGYHATAEAAAAAYNAAAIAEFGEFAVLNTVPGSAP